MEVLRHENVAVDTETVVKPCFFECLQEDLLNAVIVEKRAALITTAGDEV